MSILDSREDIAEAEARLAGKSLEQLQADLSYWTLAATDHARDYQAEHHRLAGIRTQHAEAEAMTSLIAREMQKRRDEAMS
jgi:hypothetical protein